MADSTNSNEPPEKKMRMDSTNDATRGNESTDTDVVVDSTTKNDSDPNNEKSSPLDVEAVVYSSEKESPSSDTIEPSSEIDVEDDSDKATPSLTDEENKKEIDVEDDSDKATPSLTDEENKKESCDPTDPEKVFDDTYVRSSEEESDDDDDQAAHKREIPLEPFNLDEEKAMGTFDKDLNYTWKTKSREPTDAWLANEGGKPVEKHMKQQLPEEEQEEKEPQSKEELRSLLKEIAVYMEEKETVQAAINRMSNPVAASASARLALKKAGGSYKVSNNKSAVLHEFLNLLTKLPLTADIYSLTSAEMLEIIVTEEKMEEFKEKTYPIPLIDITSGTESESSEDEAEASSKKSKKIITMSISSSDEDEEEEDEDGGRKQRPSNGSGTNDVELDMFAD